MARPDQGAQGNGMSSSLQGARQHAQLTLEQLWMRYFALGGEADVVDVDAHLAGLVTLPAPQHDMLAHAINERLDELIAEHKVPYSRPIRQHLPTSGPLAALVELVVGGGSAPPERLPALATAAGRRLGVDVGVYFVDQEQRRLVRLPGGTGSPPRLDVDSTLAGRAFRTVQVLSSNRGDRPRLWVPLLDGADRLGVLECGLESADDLYDPALREQCRWLASLLGHLVSSKEPYGDDLQRYRLAKARSASAELIWQQLPPLTGATPAFTVAGMLEPSYEVGGDAFDYALSEHTVSLAVFDAVGHGLQAGLMASAALAGYRSARRDRRGVYQQAQAIDEALDAGSFAGSAFVTGVLGELDVATGRLRYVNAGHPPPLLLRDGRVVRELRRGRRLPFGVETQGLTVGEEYLQPGDWLALYTDGVVEARNAAGAWFGEERLVELLTHEIAAGQPPPETVRRLNRAVLDHQDGLLQDDASLLLACWTGSG